MLRIKKTKTQSNDGPWESSDISDWKKKKATQQLIEMSDLTKTSHHWKKWAWEVSILRNLWETNS